ncbi:BNR repeat domain-containing protein [Thecamonas trahens ATCC 50062]|uniref:BNR repeat domain-containing protein n=1 Tax=Thecamonas trahens ATCC 50062 TaxID=461836 RepID=A0A0L0DCN4_THETB|nr:BNR repeat domain-containing protein [Thecamonas trahens ATCC 50062]KNC50082.1 BNR repeat domain-containing protein [Thecamonas trahens ATCC 50062]|eukprot:XP_013757245.1 BNR repeat domain-containing protein [Thecamonas trahens ATCC 50062]
MPRILQQFELACVVKVAVASFFSLALTRAGQVYLWGQEVSDGAHESWYGHDLEGYPAQPEVLQGDLADLRITEIATSTPGGMGTLCGVVADGTAWVWASDGEVQVTTTRIEGVTSVSVIVLGDEVGAVLTSDGAVFTFDVRVLVDPYGGPAGAGPPSIMATRVETLVGKCVVQLAAGSTYLAALDADHNMYTWGSQSPHSNGGYLGHGAKYVDPELDSEPRLVEALAGRVRAISAGWIHTMAVDVEALQGVDVMAVSNSRGNEAAISTDNKVYTWGGPRFGGQFHSDTPSPLTNFIPLYRNGVAQIQQIACGRFHTVLVTRVRLTLVELCLRHIAYNASHFADNEIDYLPLELQDLLHRFCLDRRLPTRRPLTAEERAQIRVRRDEFSFFEGASDPEYEYAYEYPSSDDDSGGEGPADTRTRTRVRTRIGRRRMRRGRNQRRGGGGGGGISIQQLLSIVSRHPNLSLQANGDGSVSLVMAGSDDEGSDGENDDGGGGLFDIFQAFAASDDEQGSDPPYDPDLSSGSSS